MKTQKTIEKKASRKSGVKRVTLIAIFVLIEVYFLISLFTYLSTTAEWINIVLKVIAAGLVIYIYSNNIASSMKTPFIILLLVFPFVGIGLFLVIEGNDSTKKMKKRFANVDGILKPYLKSQNILNEIKTKDKDIYGVLSYLENKVGFPVYKNTEVKYFSDTNDALNAQIEDMKKAKKYIFMEYFAIEDKSVWKRIQDVLVEKVKEGVEVRVFYDDFGSAWFIDWDFCKMLRELGIKCRIFNPVTAFFRLLYNNRDHRKITVIDGKIAYTGGYNLAEEYFNITHPYGMWKDTGIRINGEAVTSFIYMFLEMWNAANKKDEVDEDVSKFFNIEKDNIISNSYIQPYGDSPMDKERVGENVYLSIINSSMDYCYIMTPYLIITDEMIRSISIAAKRGVDVRIVTPGIPDKKATYSVTRSYYRDLVLDGAKIYEWTPGFCHAKMCIADDKIATVGTINFDYRSLYHHFEDGCVVADREVVTKIREDFTNIFSESNNVTEEYLNGKSKALRLGQRILRLFAELM